MGQRFWARITAGAAALLLLGVAVVLGLGAGATEAHADVDDFAIESFDAEYELGRDGDGRSTLTTIEHIVAVFPDFDQNRGLIRDLTRVYDGHSTDLQVVSVTDETGASREFSTEPYGDFLSVTIAVPEGSYVHGAQHYVIEYTQRDVTRFFDDTRADEFYWDINGTGWTQPFGRVSATVTLDDELTEAWNGTGSCYLGVLGSTDSCALSPSEHRMGEFHVEATGLTSGENVSIALGFDPGTFAAAPTPPTPFLERYPVLLWAGAASFVAGIATFITGLVRGRGARTGRAIIAQYESPEGLSVAVAAALLRVPKRAMTASLLDFAVRRKLRLLHDEASDQYGAQALDPTGLETFDRPTYAALFGAMNASSVSAGETYWFTPKSTRLGDAAASLTSRARAEAKRAGLVRPVPGLTILAVILLMIFALGLPVLHSVLVGNFTLMTVLLAVGINVLIWGLFGMSAALGARRRPTSAGAELLDHLRGLKEYIRLAEADRIRMLQSASGVEVDEQFIVGVYERLLPYAVLFGFETEWQGELAKYYRESTPDWVAGTGGTPTTFTRTLPLASFGQTVASSRTTPSISSSSGSGSGSSFSSFSGGSSGGGFSGGGGGGGGGRGI